MTLINGDDVSESDIAIIGMAVRVPGARNVREFWSNLRGGVESIRTLSTEELIESGERPDRIHKKNYVPRTADMPDMEMFDADFFGLSPKEAAIMDPQHRQFLECAWEAMEDGCRTPDHMDGPVGVFAGCGMGSYFYFNVCSHKSLVDETGMFLLRHTGNDKDFLSTRASFAFDLHGPSVNVQTACSTSLVGVHYACQSLLSGECDMALAGGSTIELPHRRGYLYQNGEILSPDGHCRAFDHRAAGTVFGSGTGVVVLRRLVDAIADGDPIRAVIKATAINNDGASKAGYLAPSVSGQAAAIVEALAIGDIPADTIQYVECHGTGTYLGDPIEIEALTQAFRQSTTKTGFCRVGSVKSNIGHLDTAAGVVSLIKAALALENGEIPPTLGFEKPNPAINFEASPFIVNDQLTPWPTEQGARRASINSLGVGGTNAHCVLQEAPRAEAISQSVPADQPQLVVLSARHPKALDDASVRLADHLKSEPRLPLADVTYSLIKGRRVFDHSRVVAVEGRDDAIAVLSDKDTKRAQSQSRVEDVAGAVFLLPGGGAQYPGMGRELYAKHELFRATVDEGLSYLAGPVADQIRELWLGNTDPDAATKLLKPSLQLPAILIIEIAVARVLEAWGIKPAAIIGHSMGENAAACLAGVLSFRDAVRLVRLRGELFDEIVGGGMLSVATSFADLEKRLPETLDIASVNAPELCVVSGSNEELDKFQASLLADEIDANRVPIDIAAHSRQLEPILSRFEAFLREITLSAPKVPIVSNLTGTWLTDEQATDPLYWTKHLRSTVRFSDCTAEAARGQRYMFIEVGPGRVLSSLAKTQSAITADQVINSLPHVDEASDDHLHLLTTIGRCWAAGLPVEIERQWQGATPARVSLPTYPFQHQRYFLDVVAPKAADGNDEPLLKLEDMTDWGWQPTWRQSLPDIRLGADKQPRSWLVFLGDTDFATAMVAKLRRSGHRVVTVAPGDAFAKLDDTSYTLCAQDGRPDYIALLQDLAENGGVPDRILHLDLVTKDERFRPGSTFFHRNQEHGFYSLFYIGQALAEVDADSEFQITVLTSGMQRVGDEALPYPEKATVLGPAQVLPREMPNISVRVIDLPAQFDDGGNMLSSAMRGLRKELNGSTATLLEQCWDDLFAQAGNEIVAYRDGRRWTREQEAVALDQADKGAARFKQGGTYIVTGGLGDLGTLFAESIATRFKAKLVLIGRIELPERQSWDSYLATYGSSDRIGNAISAIKRIEQAGGEVHYIRADVTDTEAMTAVVTEAKSRFGQINGVLHTAGIVRDELIQLKDPAEVEEVFAPKVMGTAILAEALADEPLDLIVLFSSTSADIAPAGQVDYVAANAYLNAFADSRAAQTSPQVVAIHWGIWKDTGLAARSIHLAEHGEAEQTTIATTKSLFFDRRLRDPDGREWLEGRWDASRHWILEEHRLASGHAIWPGTGYIEVIAHALSEYGIDGPYEITDLTFLRPLYVPDNAARFVRVSVTRQSGGRHNVTIESSSATENASGRLLHAEATVKALRSSGSEQIELTRWTEACNDSVLLAANEALTSAQEAHLNFGPRWKVLRALHTGDNQAVAKLELPAAYADDLDNGYRLHPALLDIATGYAMDLIPGYNPQTSLWVPMSYGSIRVTGALPQTIWSHACLNVSDDLGDGYAAFDLTITDDQGRVLVEVDKFTIKRLDQNTDFEASLTAADDADANRSAATGQTDELSPALARLAAQVEQGIAPEDGLEALLRAVGSGLPQVIVSSMDLPALQRTASHVETETASAVAFERPDLDSDFVEPRDDVERKLAEFWSELLGIQKIGVHDNFFDLGGHSLIAVRLFRMIKKAYATEFPISVLFEAPTIAQCAALISASGGAGTEEKPEGATPAAPEQRYVHLVQMHAGKDPEQTPLFICAGMFGNILNLRHLAMQIGRDRPVYGLQARGLYGDQAPHETFEEMARDYIAEIRTIQPEGPYLLAGFSGGGLAAYEMAQQLNASGDSIAIVVMLDTPYPEDVQLSMSDRVAIRMQDIEREGGAFFVRYAKWRIAWEAQRLLNRNVQPATADQFHSEEVQAAFMRALSRYDVKPYDGEVMLLRPKLKIAYRLSGDRNLNIDRGPLHPDNGWSPYVSNLSIVEVPGNHDNMVLEPNVRVLAGHMRKALDDSEWGRFYKIAAE